MTRLTVVPDLEDAVQCLLCGKAAEQYADLCNRCAGVFSSLADRITRGAVADLEAADPIPAGQLTLDDQDIDDLEGEGPLQARQLQAIAQAHDDGEWDTITTRMLERAWLFHSDLYSLSELRAMRAVVRGRAL